jgi:transcriptional regulator with XRE-family HTH domain
MAKAKHVSISDQLRRIFLERRFTPTEIAEKSGVDRSIISRFLRDDDDPQRRGLTLASVDKLADAYNLRLIEDDIPRSKPKAKAKANRLD